MPKHYVLLQHLKPDPCYSLGHLYIALEPFAFVK